MRARTQFHDVIQAVIGLVIVGAFCWVLAWAFMNGFPPARDGDQGMYLLLGSLGTALGAVMQNYFRPSDARLLDHVPSDRSKD